MANATTEPEHPVDRARRLRWDDARSDVPDSYDDGDLLRSIAADARRARDAATMSKWALYVIAGCVAICAVLAVLVVAGGLTIVVETNPGF